MRLSLREWFIFMPLFPGLHNSGLDLAAFKACRRFRKMRPIEAIIEILKMVLIFMALLAILRSRSNPEEPSREASHNILIYE